MISAELKSRLDALKQQHEGARLFALVDGLQYAAAYGQVLEAEGDYLVPLFAGTEDEPLSQSGPWLMEIVVEQFATGLAQLEETRPSVVWLISTEDVPTLANKLRVRLNAKLPDGKEVLLRFWDPRVLHALALSINESARREFFGAALAWSFLFDGKRFHINPYV